MAKKEMVPNNLEGRRKGTGPDMVDRQIVLWRKRNREQGRVLGVAMARGKRAAAKNKKDREIVKELNTKGFFGDVD